MNNHFDELTKSVAQSVTRRAALKKFGVGLAGMVLAAFGLTNKAEAAGHNCFKKCMGPCVDFWVAQGSTKEEATSTCQNACLFKCSSP